VTVAPGALTLCCADMDARPLFWTLPDGGRDGYEPGAAALVAERLELGLEWLFRRWDGFRPALEAGEADAIWCGFAITDERRRVFAYSRPYAAFDEGVLVADGSPVRCAGDLRGRRIGAIAGSTNMRLAETLGAAELVGFDGSSDDVFAEMIHAVSEGAIDAMVDDMPAFGGVLERGAFRIAHVAHTENEWGAACRLGDVETVSLIDRGLEAAIGDGSLAAEWGRWFPDAAVPAALSRAGA
jgi:polar amino acid transport system substrate-binding protein